VTGASYQEVFKNKLLPALREKRPEKAARVLFHQANAPAHRAYATQLFLRENNLEVVSRAPYSPDLAPSDFWLFPTMKDTLRGRTFTSRAAIASAILQWSKQTPTEAFAAAMELWRRRWEKCVRLQRDDVEK
jgi:histone-lysine N-methyltransferase SETMAR